MRQRAIEPPPTGELHKLRHPLHGGPCLPRPAGSAVTADHRVRMAPTLQRLDGLGERACGDLDVVTLLRQTLDQWAEHIDVRRVGQIDPNTHARIQASRADRLRSPDQLAEL